MAKRPHKSAAAEFESLPDDDDARGKGEIMDLKTLCQTLGVTRFSALQSIDRGAPVVHRPVTKLDRWQINSAAFAAWLIRDTLAQNDSAGGQYRINKTRKLVAEIERIEMANAGLRNANVTVDEAVSALRENTIVIREHLNGVPAAVVRALAALSPEDRRNASAVEAVLEDIIASAMNSIAAAA